MMVGKAGPGYSLETVIGTPKSGHGSKFPIPAFQSSEKEFLLK